MDGSCQAATGRRKVVSTERERERVRDNSDCLAGALGFHLLLIIHHHEAKLEVSVKGQTEGWEDGWPSVDWGLLSFCVFIREGLISGPTLQTCTVCRGGIRSGFWSERSAVGTDDPIKLIRSLLVKKE